MRFRDVILWFEVKGKSESSSGDQVKLVVSGSFHVFVAHGEKRVEMDRQVKVRERRVKSVSTSQWLS